MKFEANKATDTTPESGASMPQPLIADLEPTEEHKELFQLMMVVTTKEVEGEGGGLGLPDARGEEKETLPLR